MMESISQHTNTVIGFLNRCILDRLDLQYNIYDRELHDMAIAFEVHGYPSRNIRYNTKTIQDFTDWADKYIHNFLNILIFKENFEKAFILYQEWSKIHAPENDISSAPTEL